MSIFKFILCLVEAVHAPISIEKFSVHNENLHENNKYGFSEEFKVNITFVYPNLLSLNFVNNA